MADQDWQEGTLLDDEGEFRIARIRYCLVATPELDGFVHRAGRFSLREELCPLHTGLAQLRTPTGEGWLVRILRITRPQGEGALEVVEPLLPHP